MNELLRAVGLVAGGWGIAVFARATGAEPWHALPLAAGVFLIAKFASPRKEGNA